MLRSSQGSAEGATECAVDAPIVLRDPGGKRCQYKRCQYKGTHASQDTCQYEGTHASQDRCHYEGTFQYEGTHASRDRWQCPGCATGLRSVNTESCAMLSLTLTSTLIKYKEPPMACLIVTLLTTHEPSMLPRINFLDGGHWACVTEASTMVYEPSDSCFQCLRSGTGLGLGNL